MIEAIIDFITEIFNCIADHFRKGRR